MRSPFTIYKEKTKFGLCWYARFFWDEGLGRYLETRSTGILVEGKRERRREAEDKARKILAELKSPTLPESTLKKVSPKKQSRQPSKVADISFIQYLRDFWTPESEYAKYKRDVKKKPLSAYYIQMNHADIERHIAPYPGFQKISLGDVSKKLIRQWLIWMGTRKTLFRKKDGTLIERGTISGRRTNAILQGMRVAVRWAVDNEDLPVDPFKRAGEAAEQVIEKGILTPEEVVKLISSPIKDHYSRLAVLLGVLCGMRRGEVRGLQWGDINDGLISLRHNYQDTDGLKGPKYESLRTIPVPASVQSLVNTIKAILGNPAPDSFVFATFNDETSPMSNNFLRYALIRELADIGIAGAWKGKEKQPENYVNEQKRRNLTFHGLRHTFVTLGRLAGITDLEIQALAGHKDAAMMNYYSHAKQVLDFTVLKEKMENCFLPKVSGGSV